MKEWLQLQMRIFKRVRSEVDTRLARRPKAFLRYEAKYRRDQSLLRASNLKRLETSVNSSDIVLVGDFHALRQSQRFLLRLLRDPKLTKPKGVAFEVLEPQHLKPLMDWLQKPSAKKEARLRALLKLQENWGSSFETYRDIFRTTHYIGAKIIALSGKKQSLRDRDEHAAEKILESKEKVWALMGAYHCARPHLPQEILKRNSHARICVLQQDDDRLGLEQMKGSQRERIFEAPAQKGNRISLFCVQHSPIWLKYQSLLSHLDQEEWSGSTQDQVSWFIETLYQFFLDARFPKSARLSDILDVSVYNFEDLDAEIALRKLKTPLRKSVLSQLDLFGSAVCFEKQQIYLVEDTLNSCAHAAANYLLCHLWNSEWNSQSFSEVALREALAFFLSKLLNHSRKTKHWIDYKSQTSREAKTLLEGQKFLLHAKNLESWAKKLRPYRLETASVLGRILADCAFEAFLTGEFSKDRLNRILSEPPIQEREFLLRLIEIQSVGLAFERKHLQAWSN